ncbi:MAG TPA: efflux transporter periplasmic adaptor subunit [Sulfurovum sp. UBA12169]|nr:MAG TPA: efflux transporter periplasmic adaptor subunit [Sulfurovum sp. UBA12169]
MEEMQKIIQYKNHKTRWIIFFSILFLAVGIGFYSFFIKGSGGTGYRYITDPLKRGNLELTVSASGYIQPVESVDVGTEVSGTIEEVYVDYNDEVKKGQLLAVLDITKYQSVFDRAKASLEIANASLQSAQAQYYQAQTTMERNKKLRSTSKGALPTQSDWDRDWGNYLLAQAQIANANAQIEQAKHALTSAEYDLKKTKVYSPVDGTILVRNIDPGQTVAASFQTPVLFSIAKDLTNMELQISIDEADIAKIQVGQRATFSVDAYPERLFNAAIKQVRINSEILESVVTYKAIMEVNNKELLLRPGMSVDADIVIREVKDAFIIKRAALLYIPVQPKTKNLFSSAEEEKIDIDPNPHVWVLKNGVPKKIYVEVLGHNGPISAINAEELDEDDGVIINQEKRL